MKKSLLAALLLLLTALLLVGCGSGKEISGELALAMLGRDGEFQYGELAWNASREDIFAQLPECGYDSGRAPFPVDAAYYTCKETWSLNGQEGELLLDFVGDRLRILRFSFWLKEEPEEWFAEVTEELRSLYGLETEKIDTRGQGLRLETVAYKWNGETTSLQLVLQYGEDITPSVTLALGVNT